LPVSDPVLHLPLPVRMGAVADACLGLRSGFGVMPDCLKRTQWSPVSRV